MGTVMMGAMRGSSLGGEVGGLGVGYFGGVYHLTIMTDGCSTMSPGTVSVDRGDSISMSSIDSMSSMGSGGDGGEVGGLGVGNLGGVYDLSIVTDGGGTMSPGTMSTIDGGNSITSTIDTVSESSVNWTSMGDSVRKTGNGGSVGDLSVGNLGGIYDNTIMGQGSGSMSVHTMGTIDGRNSITMSESSIDPMSSMGSGGDCGEVCSLGVGNFGGVYNLAVMADRGGSMVGTPQSDSMSPRG